MTTHSQTTQGLETLLEDVEACLAKIKQLVKTLMRQVETLQRENEALRVDTTKLPEDTKPNHDRQAQSWAVGEVDTNNEDKKRMQHEFQDLVDKYKMMAKKVGALSLVDHMLTSTNLPYNVEVMVMPLPLKFRVAQIELYDGSNDRLEHLDTFKTHMTLYRFLGEIACKAFMLILKGVT